MKGENFVGKGDDMPMSVFEIGMLVCRIVEVLLIAIATIRQIKSDRPSQG